MPIFEYQCEKCDHRFEKLQKPGAPCTCPNCGAEEVKKQSSTFAASGGATSGSCSSGG